MDEEDTRRFLRKVSSWLRSPNSTIWCMKYLPVIGTVIMTVHCGLLLHGISLRAVEFLVSFPMSSMLMFFLLSKQFHFCILHKCLIGYVSVMEICIFLQYRNVWGPLLIPARWTMFIIGCMLIVCCVAKRWRGNCCVLISSGSQDDESQKKELSL